MNHKAVSEKTLVIEVPQDQQTINVRLEVEAGCNCSSHTAGRAGSYVDMELPASTTKRV